MQNFPGLSSKTASANWSPFFTKEKPKERQKGVKNTDFVLLCLFHVSSGVFFSGDHRLLMSGTSGGTYAPLKLCLKPRSPFWEIIFRRALLSWKLSTFADLSQFCMDCWPGCVTEISQKIENILYGLEGKYLSDHANVRRWTTARWKATVGDAWSWATWMHSVRPGQTHATVRSVKGHISSVMKLKRQLDRIKSIANEYMNKQMCK